MFLINFVYQALLLVLTPLVAVAFALNKRGRVRYRERFGFNRIPHAHYDLWWHAASLGEVQGLLPLIKLAQGRQLLTITSPTALIKDLPSHLTIRIAPIDSLLWYKLLFGSSSFKVLVVTETELWPGMLQFAINRNAKIAWVNMRVRPANVRWYRLIRLSFSKALSSAKIFAASLADAARWSEVFPALPPPQVLGNSKFDREPTISGTAQSRAIHSTMFAEPQRLLVLGSMHLGELEIILPGLEKLGELVPDLQVIIAPRHRERDRDIAALLEQRGFAFEKRSEMSKPAVERIVLLDTFGELEGCFSCADAAFIGGSLVELGGHNPLEAAQYGCPILMGPHTDVVQVICDELKQAGALFTISNERDFVSHAADILNDRALRVKLGEAARVVARRHRGASIRILKALNEFIDTDSSSANRVTTSDANVL